MKKTFLLGVGAQKAGTTWLHSYVNSFDNVNMGGAKEYHVWNVIYGHSSPRFKITKKTLSEAINDEDFAKQKLRQRMHTKPNYYEEYFDGIATGEIEITGDITPGYAVLTRDELKQIKQRLETKGFTVKVVFLMRDPFERIWSAIRMRRAKRVLAGEDNNSLNSEVKNLLNAYSRKIPRGRTDYKTTVQNLESVFEPENLFFGIFEELFTPESAARLSEFLGIGLNSDLFDVKVNMYKKESEIPMEVKNEIREFYRDVYEFCYERFPQTKDLWRA